MKRSILRLLENRRSIPTSPRQLWHRLFGFPVFAGVPKCGTHLLERALSSFGHLLQGDVVTYTGNPAGEKHSDRNKIARQLRATLRGTFVVGHLMVDSEFTELLRNLRYRMS